MAALMKDGGRALPDSFRNRLMAQSKLSKPERLRFLSVNLDDGWGSSFRSENLVFYQLKERKPTEIWNVVKKEYTGNILPFNRVVTAAYRVHTDSMTRVTYTYRLSDRETGKKVWKKVFSITYQWNPATSRLYPVLPPGAPEPFDADCPFSYEYFETWLSDDLESL